MSAELLSPLEYRSLLQLLCPDFPAEVVQNAARSVLHRRTTDTVWNTSRGLSSWKYQGNAYQESVLCSSCRMVLMDDAGDCLLSFSDFIYAFQLQFYYQGAVLHHYLCILCAFKCFKFHWLVAREC